MNRPLLFIKFVQPLNPRKLLKMFSPLLYSILPPPPIYWEKSFIKVWKGGGVREKWEEENNW